ncbi:MAG: ABC transporter permease, partial [Rhodospirillales bacterium]|nr:ABC transporter permease [Rhodospirillales bacterium]
MQAFLRFAGRRLLFGLPTIWLLISFVFVMVHMAPGDPLTFITGDADVSTEQLAQLRREYGLDQPLSTQYAIYVSKIVQGELGQSYRYREPVLDLIQDRSPATLTLMIPSLVIFVGLGIFLGTVTARAPNSVGDFTLSGVALFGWSVPVFWLAQLLVIAFALQLGWFPTQGMLNLRTPSTGFAYVIDVSWHLVLPA